MSRVVSVHGSPLSVRLVNPRLSCTYNFASRASAASHRRWLPLPSQLVSPSFSPRRDVHLALSRPSSLFSPQPVATHLLPLPLFLFLLPLVSLAKKIHTTFSAVFSAFHPVFQGHTGAISCTVECGLFFHVAVRQPSLPLPFRFSSALLSLLRDVSTSKLNCQSSRPS
ncbi:hypothetical protein TRVL_09037 [Trypanosoma vivax]|nr:hypothetical protein TRVL_09037 [Trypanosoma vivax]